MERDWLNNFYKECGREVSLAYNVLNQTNNWAITLITAVLATGFIGSVRFDSNGVMNFNYPTIYHWAFIIVAWIINIRFFMRSALALVNMYRWNTLIYAIVNVLSLPENHPSENAYKKDLSKKINEYFINWRSPISKKKLIWENLRLIYLWFFLILIALFITGVILLERNIYYYIGIIFFHCATIFELVEFFRYYGFRYIKIESTNKQKIYEIWEKELNQNENKK